MCGGFKCLHVLYGIWLFGRLVWQCFWVSIFERGVVLRMSLKFGGSAPPLMQEMGEFACQRSCHALALHLSQTHTRLQGKRAQLRFRVSKSSSGAVSKQRHVQTRHSVPFCSTGKGQREAHIRMHCDLHEVKGGPWQQRWTRSLHRTQHTVKIGWQTG